MIDLPLMAKLATALKENCRLILLGDKDQLASVEPGAVFGDICDTGSVNTFSTGFASAVGQLISSELPHQEVQGSVLADSIVVLQKSYRFGPESGIGLLASAVKECNSSEAFILLKGTNQAKISTAPLKKVFFHFTAIISHRKALKRHSPFSTGFTSSVP
jgi:exodeoxyribonuclease V alpha subunit